MINCFDIILLYVQKTTHIVPIDIFYFENFDIILLSLFWVYDIFLHSLLWLGLLVIFYLLLLLVG